MAVTITVAEVRDCVNTTKSDGMIQNLITMIDGADQCLDANMVPDATQTVLKINAVAHLITLQDGGQVKSQRSFTGESVTVETPKTGSGLAATTFGELVLNLIGGDCIEALINRPKRFARSINPYNRDTDATQQNPYRIGRGTGRGIR